jgi:hypothetical protein
MTAPNNSSEPLQIQTDLTNQVLKLIRRKKRCGMEELLQGCTSYTWNQVFLEVDRLTRSGELRLEYKKDGDYVMSLPRAA